MSPVTVGQFFVTAPLVFSWVSIFCPWIPLGISFPRLPGLSPLVNSWLCPCNLAFLTRRFLRRLWLDTAGWDWVSDSIRTRS